jgi:tetratricopeptide (TPR) repeat protein
LVPELKKKALDILKECLSARHSRLGVMYKNIGELYESTDDLLEAYKYYQTARDIQQECLPSNHPDLATIIHNIGSIAHKTALPGSLLRGKHNKFISKTTIIYMIKKGKSTNENRTYHSVRCRKRRMDSSIMSHYNRQVNTWRP